MKSEMQINNKKKEIFGTVSIIGGFLLFIFGYLFYTISIDAMGEAFVTRAERMGLFLIFPSLLFIGVGYHLRFKKKMDYYNFDYKCCTD